MGDFLCDGRAHMARGAGWIEVIPPGMPLFRRVGELHLLLVRLEHDAVFTLIIGLDLRMIRPHMTATTALRLARLGDRKTMPRMTGGAGALGPVGIHPSDTGIRPSGWMELSVFHDFNDAPMTARAPGCHDFRPFHDIAEEVVERAGELRALGMMRFCKFLRLSVVAAHAIFRRDQRGDKEALMVVGIRVAFLSPVTFDTSNAFRRMPTGFPVVDPADPDILGHMAIDTLLVLGRDERPEAPTAPLLDLDISDSREGQEQNQAQPADHVAGKILLPVAQSSWFVVMAAVLCIRIVHTGLLRKSLHLRV